MRISDWSSDVCSSDLAGQAADATGRADQRPGLLQGPGHLHAARQGAPGDAAQHPDRLPGSVFVAEPADDSRDRKSVVSGKSVSVRVDIGGRRIIKTKNKTHRIDRNFTKKRTKR